MGAQIESQGDGQGLAAAESERQAELEPRDPIEQELLQFSHEKTDKINAPAQIIEHQADPPQLANQGQEADDNLGVSDDAESSSSPAVKEEPSPVLKAEGAAEEAEKELARDRLKTFTEVLAAYKSRFDYSDTAGRTILKKIMAKEMAARGQMSNKEDIVDPLEDLISSGISEDDPLAQQIFQSAPDLREEFREKADRTNLSSSKAAQSEVAPKTPAEPDQSDQDEGDEDSEHLDTNTEDGEKKQLTLYKEYIEERQEILEGHIREYKLLEASVNSYSSVEVENPEERLAELKSRILPQDFIDARLNLREVDNALARIGGMFGVQEDLNEIKRAYVELIVKHKQAGKMPAVEFKGKKNVLFEEDNDWLQERKKELEAPAKQALVDYVDNYVDQTNSLMVEVSNEKNKESLYLDLVYKSLIQLLAEVSYFEKEHPGFEENSSILRTVIEERVAGQSLYPFSKEELKPYADKIYDQLMEKIIPESIAKSGVEPTHRAVVMFAELCTDEEVGSLTDRIAYFIEEDQNSKKGPANGT